MTIIKTKTLIYSIAVCIFLLTNCSPHKYVTKEKGDWKIYTDDLCGFSFQLPATWIIDNDNGLSHSWIMGGPKYFKDTTFKTLFLILCMEDTGGIWQFEVSQFDSIPSKWIEVAGVKAIEKLPSLSKTDGKGHPLDPSDYTKVINIDFRDKNQTHEINMVFRTSLAHYKDEVKKFNQLLSTFKFNN